MIEKELHVWLCGYCNCKFTDQVECVKCETCHENKFSAENGRFTTFKSEITGIVSHKHTRPMTTVQTQTGTDTEGNPTYSQTQVPGDLQTLHCSRCLRLIHENTTYIDAFGQHLCLECAISLLRIFARNYLTFRQQFSAASNTGTNCTPIDADANQVNNTTTGG